MAQHETPIGRTAQSAGAAYLCWAVSDGRPGMENQVLGLAEAASLFLPLRVTPKRIMVKEPWRRLPRALWGDPFSKLSPTAALLRPPFPDLWIACGRMTTLFTAAVRKINAATYTVQTQAPRASLQDFDLVIPPLHDRLKGENVFPIIGAPNRITSARLERDAELLAPALAHLGRPRVAVLIGGSNRAHSLVGAKLDAFIKNLRALADNGAGLMITTSRRTDARFARSLAAALDGAPHFFWDGTNVAGLANPYFGMLGLADHIIVTADSVNMATDAAVTGKPIHIAAFDPTPAPSGGKFEHFHAMLRAYGAARPFTGGLATWTYRPLDETARAAAEIARRFQAARNAGLPIR